MTTDEQRRMVIDHARAWLATPYHHQGRIKGAGADCATLLCEVYHAAGMIPFIDPTPYPPDWHLHRDDERYLGWLQQYAHPVEEPQPGDVIVWRFGRCFSHGAVYVGDGQIIHAYIGRGVVLDSINSAVLLDRAVQYYSMWGE